MSDEISILDSTLLSVGIAVAATAVAAGVGIPLAYLSAHRRYVGKWLVEGLLMMPMVLPPTVVGYLLLVLAGREGLVGSWLYKWFGYSLVFRFEGAVLAAAIVALPLLYVPARAAFAGVDPELEEVATLLGARRLRVFFQVSLPLAMRGVMAGLTLAFARALGEFGATLMVFGWQPKRVTLPISIWAYFEQGELGRAWPAVAAMSGLSLVLILFYNKTVATRRR